MWHLLEEASVNFTTEKLNPTQKNIDTPVALQDLNKWSEYITGKPKVKSHKFKK